MKQSSNSPDDVYGNIWYPYFGKNIATQLPIKVVNTEGSKLILSDGRQLIDGTSSWWSVCHGYKNPYIVAKMQRQVADMSHVMLAGIIHDGVVELSKKLINFTGNLFSKVFFSDSGSIAVEVAIKMAVQYSFNRYKENGSNKKNKILYFKNSYHGDTFAMMSISESMKSLNTHFTDCVKLDNVIELSFPKSESEVAEFEEYIAKNSDIISACIMEPMVQCAGDFTIHSVSIVNNICKIIKQNDILLIFDEVAVGFYRTGNRFVFSKLDTKPDIVTLSKALTAGYIGMGATLATAEVFDTVCETQFMHGPTFMGNPLACSAALASIELFETGNVEQDLAVIDECFANLFKSLPSKRLNSRYIGAIFAVTVGSEAASEIKKFVCQDSACLIFVRPIGETLYLMPPINISRRDLTVLCREFATLCEKFA